eukprot:2976439-Rhodomonas_salina.2
MGRGLVGVWGDGRWSCVMELEGAVAEAREAREAAESAAQRLSEEVAQLQREREERGEEEEAERQRRMEQAQKQRCAVSRSTTEELEGARDRGLVLVAELRVAFPPTPPELKDSKPQSWLDLFGIYDICF